MGWKAHSTQGGPEDVLDVKGEGDYDYRGGDTPRRRLWGSSGSLGLQGQRPCLGARMPLPSGLLRPEAGNLHAAL